jgi:cadmium resistance protein CadD (predicted permease)
LKGKSQATAEPTAHPAAVNQEAVKKTKKAKEKKKNSGSRKTQRVEMASSPTLNLFAPKFKNVKKRNRQLLCCLFFCFVLFLFCCFGFLL